MKPKILIIVLVLIFILTAISIHFVDLYVYQDFLSADKTAPNRITFPASLTVKLIHNGMSIDTVYAILGKPHHSSGSGLFCGEWDMINGDTFYAVFYAAPSGRIEVMDAVALDNPNNLLNPKVFIVPGILLLTAIVEIIAFCAIMKRRPACKN